MAASPQKTTSPTFRVIESTVWPGVGMSFLPNSVSKDGFVSGVTRTSWSIWLSLCVPRNLFLEAFGDEHYRVEKNLGQQPFALLDMPHQLPHVAHGCPSLGSAPSSIRRHARL